MEGKILKASEAAAVLLVATVGFFYYGPAYIHEAVQNKDSVSALVPMISPVVQKAEAARLQKTASSTPPYQRHPDISLSSIHPTVATGTARVTLSSPPVFAYAHGTVEADGKFFVGMANKAGNIYPSNQLTIFSDEADLSRPSLIEIPESGDIQTMTYDAVNDQVYFLLSNTTGLKLYRIDPHTYAISSIISTTTVDAGRKPAIATDGIYVYGITDTNPSTVFRIRISDGALTLSRKGHIPNGHSAAIAQYSSPTGPYTEVYFSGGMTNGFEKVDGATLKSVSSLQGDPCAMSDDMAFVRTSDSGGYIYIGCEVVPYGLRIQTTDMSVQRFSLPGGSFGLFAFGDDMYNAAQDGYIDEFPGGNLNNLHRYHVTNTAMPFDTKGQDLEVNELLYSPLTHKLYFTAWLGIPGLHQVEMSTP